MLIDERPSRPSAAAVRPLAGLAVLASLLANATSVAASNASARHRTEHRSDARRGHRVAGRSSPGARLEAEAELPSLRGTQQEEFVLDNSALDARSPGLGYRSSPALDDTSGGMYAAWGSTVRGVRVADGWVKTPSGFLPTEIRGVPVLLPVHPPDAGIVQSTMNRSWWGSASYVRYLDTGLQSWEELARLHGHLGNTCTQSTVQKQCGTHLVCNGGICGECQISRDCSDKFRCQYFALSGRNMCVLRDLTEQWTWREVLCTVLIVITAMLSAAAGMGGGGVYVPLLLLLCDFSTQEAVPLSQAMIVGGATVNIFMFCGERHPKYAHRPKIDYDVIMMLNPGLAVGVTLGVMLNLISPQWIIVLVLIVTLVLALQKSLTKGIAQFKKESKVLEEQAAAGQGSGGGGGEADGRAPKGGAGLKLKFVDIPTFAKLASSNTRSIGLILGCWLVFFAANMLKATQCSRAYWMQLGGLIITCFAFTWAGARTVMQKASASDAADGVLAWTPTTLWLYPLLSTAAGFLGGFLGIGGGIIIGPLLLELGMAAEASQATTAMFVFLSSSLATVQFVVLGRAMPEYAMWFTTWVLLATFVGQTLVDYALQKYQRSSLIVLCIAAILAGSLVMMTAVGTMDIVGDVLRGAYMGFSPMDLCK